MITLTPCHHCVESGIRSVIAFHHLEQSHHWHRVEEVKSAKKRFILQIGANRRHRQRRRICRQNARVGRRRLQIGKELLLQLQILDNGLDDQLGIGAAHAHVRGHRNATVSEQIFIEELGILKYLRSN